MKQEVIVADATGKAMLTMWGADVNLGMETKSNRVVVKYYIGKPHMSLPPTGSTIDD